MGITSQCYYTSEPGHILCTLWLKTLIEYSDKTHACASCKTSLFFDAFLFNVIDFFGDMPYGLQQSLNLNKCLPTFSRSRYSHHICINISRTKSINQGFCIRRFKMGVLEHVIEFINEAACNKDFAEDNWIG